MWTIKWYVRQCNIILTLKFNWIVFSFKHQTIKYQKNEQTKSWKHYLWVIRNRFFVHCHITTNRARWLLLFVESQWWGERDRERKSTSFFCTVLPNTGHSCVQWQDACRSNLHWLGRTESFLTLFLYGHNGKLVEQGEGEIGQVSNRQFE